MGSLVRLPPEEKFSLKGDRYNQNSFLGRALKFFHVVDPRTLLPDLFFGLSLNDAQKLLADYKAKQSLQAWREQELWTARKIVEAQVHPDTGEIIPPPFRMSGFVPFGSPIIVGMLMSGTSPASTVFWQWLNQSHNAAVNYSNRNASVAVSNEKLFQSYAVAVTTAVGVKLGADKVVQHLNRPMLGRFAPFLAVASANVLNVGMMRSTELSDGIVVTDQDENYIGHSVVAAKKALQETALTRVLLPIPILVFSPLMLLSAEKLMPNLLKIRSVNIATQTVIVVGNFLVGLPLSISCFKQRGELSLDAVEPQLQEKARSLGASILTYNKGL